MPMITTKAVQLPEDIGMYVDALRKKYSAIDEVWLLGPRLNAPAPRGEPWDLLAFADPEVLETLRTESSAQREDVTLTIVVDGERFEGVWDRSRKGRLEDIGWRLEDLHHASYIEAPGPGGGEDKGRASAMRVR